MQNANGVNYSMDQKVQERRKRVIVRLEKQLKLGTKIVTFKENGIKVTVAEDLNTQDVKRINQELETLKTRC
jgi:hypothetical protein